MVLNDIVIEYKKVESVLLDSEQFFKLANEIINSYESTYKNICITIFTNINSNQLRDNAVAEMNQNLSKAYGDICKLNTNSRKIMKIIGVLETQHICFPLLNEEIDKFIQCANNIIDIIDSIIEIGQEGMKKTGKYNDLVQELKSLLNLYDYISLTVKQYIKTEDFLLDEIPEIISDDEKYDMFTIHSQTQLSSFDQITASISSFAQTYDNIIRLCELSPSDRYYIRKIETGSILITITGLIASISSISKFIDYCFKKYIEYTKANLEIHTMRVEFVQKELEAVNVLLDLNPNLENKSELIEKACEGAFKYFKLNPVFRIGDKEYRGGEQIKVISTEK